MCVFLHSMSHLVPPLILCFSFPSHSAVVKTDTLLQSRAVLSLAHPLNQYLPFFESWLIWLYSTLAHVQNLWRKSTTTLPKKIQGNFKAWVAADGWEGAHLGYKKTGQWWVCGREWTFRDGIPNKCVDRVEAFPRLSASSISWSVCPFVHRKQWFPGSL